MTDGPDRLDARLQALAAALDSETPSVSPAEAMGARAATRVAPPRLPRLVLVGVTATFAVVVGVLAWIARGDDERSTRLISPGPSSTSTSSTLPGFDFSSLPRQGVAVQALDGPLRLYGLDGEPLGTAPALVGTHNERRLSASSPEFTAELPATVEVPEGCSGAEVRGARRVALCGGSTGLPHRIDLVDHTGTATTLVDGHPLEPGAAGHWVTASPSPNGRWVLAQWSGECESPQAIVIDIPSGAASAIGSSGVAGPPPESIGLGWADDGRAVVDLREGLCGTGADAPGTYLLDPSTAELELVVAADQISDQAFLWTGIARGNGLEKLFHQAVDELGLEPTGGEPSHGGPGVTSGVPFEGREVLVYGAPFDDPTARFASDDWRLVPLLGSEAVVSSGSQDSASPDPATFVLFTCGGTTWRFSWNGPSTQPDSMLRLAELLLPHLGCTLGPPPDVVSPG